MLRLSSHVAMARSPAVSSLGFPLRAMGVVVVSTFMGLVGGFHKSVEVKFPTWRE